MCSFGIARGAGTFVASLLYLFLGCGLSLLRHLFNASLLGLELHHVGHLGVALSHSKLLLKKHLLLGQLLSLLLANRGSLTLLRSLHYGSLVKHELWVLSLKLCDLGWS